MKAAVFVAIVFLFGVLTEAVPVPLTYTMKVNVSGEFSGQGTLVFDKSSRASLWDGQLFSDLFSDPKWPTHLFINLDSSNNASIISFDPVKKTCNAYNQVNGKMCGCQQACSMRSWQIYNPFSVLVGATQVGSCGGGSIWQNNVAIGVAAGWCMSWQGNPIWGFVSTETGTTNVTVVSWSTTVDKKAFLAPSYCTCT